ncbi:alpha/beta hydrolase [Schaalia odontolytica]
MAISWADILEWETGPLDSIGSDLLEASSGLRGAYEQGEGALQAVQSQGNAVTAMRATTISNLASLERALTNVNGALIAIEGARDGVATVMANINALQAYAETNDCTILNDGSVVGDGSRTQRGGTSSAKYALEQGIKDVIKQADQVDTDLYHALSDINTDTYTDGDKKDNKVVGVADHPKKDWTPSQVAAWWNSLPEKQQKHLIDHCPDEVRHLDGLPASARDRANRNALNGYFDDRGKYRPGALADAEQAVEDAQKEYEDARTRLSGEPRSGHMGSEERAAKEKLDRAKEAYQDLAAIKSQTDPNYRLTHGLAPAYLLDFNYDEKYKRTTAIVSSGNPDTATHVSTTVPGIGTNVRGDLGYYMDFNDRLRQQTAHAGVDPGNVATISYLGYVAPKNSGVDIVQAADIGYAERAAPKLARFEEGLRASANANGHQFTNTLIGHSYGSTTSGRSMTLVAPGTVDRFIMAGSPGAGADTIDAYNVPPDNVYVSAIPRSDSVQNLNPYTSSGYGSDPRYLDGITHLSGDVTDSAKYVPPFVDPTGTNPLGAIVHRFQHALDHHMAYFHEGTRTSQDFANIVAGSKPTTDEEWAAIKEARTSDKTGH